jgi:hypothetical protein
MPIPVGSGSDIKINNIFRLYLFDSSDIEHARSDHVGSVDNINRTDGTFLVQKLSLTYINPMSGVYIPGLPIVIMRTSNSNWVADVNHAMSRKDISKSARGTLVSFRYRHAISVCILCLM